MTPILFIFKFEDWPLCVLKEMGEREFFNSFLRIKQFLFLKKRMKQRKEGREGGREDGREQNKAKTTIIHYGMNLPT